MLSVCEWRDKGLCISGQSDLWPEGMKIPGGRHLFPLKLQQPPGSLRRVCRREKGGLQRRGHQMK